MHFTSINCTFSINFTIYRFFMIINFTFPQMVIMTESNRSEQRKRVILFGSLLLGFADLQHFAAYLKYLSSRPLKAFPCRASSLAISSAGLRPAVVLALSIVITVSPCPALFHNHCTVHFLICQILNGFPGFTDCRKER